MIAEVFGPLRESSAVITFWLAGNPEPQGSKRGFVNRKTGRAMVVDVEHGKLRSWRQEIITAARNAYAGPPLDVALSVKLVFAFSRPLGHFNAKGLLAPRAPRHMEAGKDLDKLIRAVLDALTIAGTIRDDRRVGRLECVKDFVDVLNFDGPGLYVQVSTR